MIDPLSWLDAAEEAPLQPQPADDAPGRRLLHDLGAAGYELRLEKSRYDRTYTIIPIGKGREGTDFEALFRDYERHHDEALRLLLEVCERLRIAPERWHVEAPTRWEALLRDAEAEDRPAAD